MHEISRIAAMRVTVDRACGLTMVACLTLIACSYGSGEFRAVRGRNFPAERKNEIQQGATASQVHAVFGAPLEVVRNSNDIQWKYFVVEEARNTTFVLGIAFTRVARIRTTSAVIHFKDDRVSRLDYNSVVQNVR